MEEDIKEILTALDNTTKKQLDEAIANADKEWSEMELEEDIKILEGYLNGDKIYDTELDNALRHLIERNKELERFNDMVNRKVHRLLDDNMKLLKEDGNTDKLNYKYIETPKIECEEYKSESFIEENYIPKSKVRELKENIHYLLDNNGIARGYQIEIDRLFEELLED